MTAVDVTNVLMGPVDVYVGAFGATEPTVSDWVTAIDTGIWVPAGATSGGVKLSVAIDTKTLEVDQVPEEVGVRVTGRKLAVETEMAESTLENVKFLMNGGTLATGALTPAGLGKAAIVPLMKAGFVDWIINLIGITMKRLPMVLTTTI